MPERDESQHEWRHGWVPLTLHAAVLKAHGNHERAELLLAEGRRRRRARRARRAEFVTPHPAHQAEHAARTRLRALTDDQLAASMGTADDAELGRIEAELNRRDRAERKAAADRDRRGRRRRARDDARLAEVDRLILAGADPQDAYRTAYGLTEESERRQEVVARLRGDGHRGRNFEALARSYHREELRQAYLRAEDATRGHVLSPAGKRAGVDPESLFEGPRARADKYASEELRDFWREHGRPTLADTKAALLGGRARTVTAGDVAA